MSTLYVSATPVTFYEGSFQMLIDGTPPPYRVRVEVSTLAHVMAAIETARKEVGALDPTAFRHIDGDEPPNGFKLYARILAGRAPNGFNKLVGGREHRALFDVRAAT